jgi:hypothetical protein
VRTTTSSIFQAAKAVDLYRAEHDEEHIRAVEKIKPIVG